jgi:hypothetical protein
VDRASHCRMEAVMEAVSLCSHKQTTGSSQHLRTICREGGQMMTKSSPKSARVVLKNGKKYETVV